MICCVVACFVFLSCCVMLSSPILLSFHSSSLRLLPLLFPLLLPSPILPPIPPLLSPHPPTFSPSIPLFYSTCNSELRTTHPEWIHTSEGDLIGLTYDGRAALYSSVQLDFKSKPSVCAVPSKGESATPCTSIMAALNFSLMSYAL